MRILLLGGTWFLGRAVADEALSRGWSVTTFNRGRSAADLAGVEAIHGDRTSPRDLERLTASGPWDVVVDTSASEMAPCQVLAGARTLSAQTGRYVYVSTVNAYTGWPDEPLTEDSPTYGAPADADRGYGADADGPTHYGIQKSGSEAAVLSQFAGRSTILRPSVILGPGEYVGRLPWWLRRAERGGTVLAPGRPDKLIQPVDVRDVAAFALDAPVGNFNVAAPLGRATMSDLLDACLQVTGRRGHLTWADDDLLTRHGVREWVELPLWRTAPGTWAVDTTRAMEAGLVCRPLPDTVADTWAWLQGGEGRVPHPRWDEHGLDPVKERAILGELVLD
ncbi:NAD-dependent epimerase/dehydratase family protein [Streptomyces tsukubensis]|uniref:NAD-dependent epimerase n=1 Tax=Streptomyces tsukubensis TaxID=83656 RepID=A0A1V4A5Q3_9ACTN|nr:NAD-dependent epimerase/dehydratase family protein [Streptomyces tsukubensis]OON75636.1 NAD-dependent epimerase [Streptomyces tsukubensis]QFR94381.1 NAD-dependent epimerase/dehydratase family protein [Streptomyces tsukubensis]